MDDDVIKRPRLYVDHDLTVGSGVLLTPEHVHYLKNVLRCPPGGTLRLFNGRNGEWLATLEYTGKKTAQAVAVKNLLPQPAAARSVHLVFAPIKKARMDWLIEKAVELGATHLHPVLTQNTDVRALNDERLRQQIIEAAEQCERLDVPVLHDVLKLDQVLGQWNKTIPLIACLERFDAMPLAHVLPEDGPIAFLIGPEGGFTRDEKDRLSAAPFIRPASLGPLILRSETAVCTALSVILAQGESGP